MAGPLLALAGLRRLLRLGREQRGRAAQGGFHRMLRLSGYHTGASRILAA